MKTLFLLTMTVRVTATTTHRTVFIIVIKKEQKQFFSFEAISDVKIFGLQKIVDANIFRHFFCPKFFALNVLFDIPKYMKQQLQKVQNAAAGFGLNKYANINDLINIKWLPIKERIEYSLAVMGFKAICDENIPNHLKLPQKVASTRNLRYNYKGILININQQSKTFEKQSGNIFNKLPTTFDQ